MLGAVILPDLFGFALTTFYFVLFILLASQAAADSLQSSRLSVLAPGSLFLPAALRFVPAGLVTAALLVLAARAQCFWLTLNEETLALATPSGFIRLGFCEIAAARLEPRQPPIWLVLLFVFFAGIIGMAIAFFYGTRASHAMVMETRRGDTVRLAADAFRPGVKALAGALAGAGVPIDSALARAGGAAVPRGGSATSEGEPSTPAG
ncbi:hypothetical protein [Consotaella aegiceratis]|uniref:hypothetical protein n=1 Tax=Consotaella aegiceratis TaxID=3097961 RepID=UPI002F3FE0A5